HAVLSRVPVPSLRRWFERRRARFLAVDAHCGRLAAGGARLAAAAAWFYVGWLVESLETYVLLHLLGAQVPFVAVVAIEASVALIRSLTVFAPAGLGFQDASYLGFFHAFALPDWANVGAAFMVLKRGKEALWIVVGYLLLVAGRGPARAAGRRPRV